MRNIKIHPLAFLGALLFLSSLFLANDFFHSRQTRLPAQTAKLLIGNVERIGFGKEPLILFDAKIDSGAQSSSIHAFDLKFFTEVEGGIERDMVRFKTTDLQNREIVLIKEVHRKGLIKNAVGISDRYFIKETITLGGNEHEVEVSLADRSHLERKFLVGKNVLDFNYYIDTSQSYLLLNTDVNPKHGIYLTTKR